MFWKTARELFDEAKVAEHKWAELVCMLFEQVEAYESLMESGWYRDITITIKDVTVEIKRKIKDSPSANAEATRVIDIIRAVFGPGIDIEVSGEPLWIAPEESMQQIALDMPSVKKPYVLSSGSFKGKSVKEIPEDELLEWGKKYRTKLTPEDREYIDCLILEKETTYD